MRVVVLGGGVIGVSSAYYLARAGCTVQLIERGAEVAAETSFANAGQISPGYAAPWASPGLPLKALKWLFAEHAPLAIRPDGSLRQLAWMAAMLRQCTPGRYAINKARMVRLAEYSRDCLRALREETGLRYEDRQLGTLQVFRTAAQLEAAARDVAVLREADVPFSLLGPDELARVEPALGGRGGLAGGLHLPGDETGDCRLFTQRLAEMAATLGVRFEFGCTALRVETLAGQLQGVRVADAQGRLSLVQADACVVALGAYGPALLSPLLSLPVYPVKGYSITVPIVDPGRAPRSTVLDESYKIALTRFDTRIRVGGMAELRGFDLRLHAHRRRTLELSLGDLFPGAGDPGRADFWTGLRPMTPDGTPIVGPTPIRGLYLNTGHGTLGWTMACGSARVLADQICGRAPEIEAADLGLQRNGGPARAARGAVAAQPLGSQVGRPLSR